MTVTIAAMFMGAAITVVGCSTECERVIDKELECTGDAAGALAGGLKAVAVKMCESRRKAPEFKVSIDCMAATSTCDEFRACKMATRQAARAAETEEMKAAAAAERARVTQERADEVTKLVSVGKLSKAVSDCSNDLKAYQAGGPLQEACDGAFNVAATQLKPADKLLSVAMGYMCSRPDVSAWGKASAPFTKACAGIAAQKMEALEAASEAGTLDGYACRAYLAFVKKSSPDDLVTAHTFCEQALRTANSKKTARLQKVLEAQRDNGTKHDVMDCVDYLKLRAKHTPEEQAAAKMLCEEAQQASEHKEAIELARKALREKRTRPPLQCRFLLEEGETELRGSKWFAVQAPILAKACYGDLGKLILRNVTKGPCMSSAKAVHTWAAKYNLGASDPELEALLTETRAACGK